MSSGTAKHETAAVTGKPGQASAGTPDLAGSGDPRSLLEALPDPLFIHDDAYRVRYANAAYLELVGRSWSDIEGRPYWEMLPGCDACPYLCAEPGAATAGHESELVLEDGRTLRLRCTPVPAENTGTSRWLHVLEDITGRKQREARTAYLARFDELTGLVNRSQFHDHLRQALATLRRGAETFAVLYIDVDRFKQVNDSLGHGRGDELLKQFAARIVAAIREADIAARVGGDEFVILQTGITDTAGVVGLARRLLHSFQQPFQFDGRETRVTASIGIAVAEQDAEPDELVSRADTAMYRAKTEGRDRCVVYDRELEASMQWHIAIHNAIGPALDRGEFSLRFQPQVRVEDGSPEAAEVLIRWQHPEWGAVSPAAFIEVAERTGQIVEVSEWVISEACRQWQVWQAAGLPPVRLALNLSAAQLRDPGFAQHLHNLIESTDVPSEYLELELTERVLLDDPERAGETLAALQDLGLGLAIDDFGTGFASLEYLRLFPGEKIKIAQEFTHGMLQDATDAAIVESIIELAHKLDLTVLAEGVENRAQVEFLRARGCDLAQGFYYSEPLPGDAFRSLLENQS